MHEWVLEGACKGKQELYFPARYERADARRRREKEAKSICEGCPVTEPCRRLGAECELRYIDDEYYPDGIWGGLNRSELQKWFKASRT